MNGRTSALLILIVLTALGGWLRARHVASLPLWYDEADTWRSSIIEPIMSDATWSKETGQIEHVPMGYVRFFQWTNHFETAPLTFLLERLSTDLLGTTAEWAMRLPSLIAGILCIPAMFMLGRLVHSRGAGLFAAALAAVDPNFVDQSRQARMYMVMALLTILTLALAIRLLRRPDATCCAPNSHTPNNGPNCDATIAATTDRWAANLWQWIALGALFGLTLACSQFATCVWIGVALSAVALVLGGKLTGQPHPQPVRLLSSLAAAFVVAIMLTNVGVFGIVNRVFFGGPGDGEHLSKADIAREIVVAAKDLINLTPAGLLVYVLAAVGVALLFRKCKTSTVVIACIMVTNVLVLFPFRKMHHFLDGRYLTTMQPAIMVSLAVFAIGFQAKLLRNIAAGLVVAYLAVQTWQCVNIGRYYPQPDRYLFPQRIIAARDQMKPGETMSIYPGVAMSLGQYYRVPQDHGLFDGLYTPFEQQPRPSQRVDASLRSRCSATWLVMGMYNYDDGKQKANRTRTIQMIADVYGVKPDPAELDKHLQRERVATIRISTAGVEISSAGVHDAK